MKVYTPAELRKLISDTLIPYHGLLSLESLDQLMGTCAHESHMGRHRKQVGGGPALGIMQVEPPTFSDIQHRYGHRFPVLMDHVPVDLMENDELSILVARLKYLDSPKALPPAGNVNAQAEYWGKWYQGMSDPHKIAQYRIDYLEFIMGVKAR